MSSRKHEILTRSMVSQAVEKRLHWSQHLLSILLAQSDSCVDFHFGLTILVCNFHVRTAHHWKQDLDPMHFIATKS